MNSGRIRQLVLPMLQTALLTTVNAALSLDLEAAPEIESPILGGKFQSSAKAQDYPKCIRKGIYRIATGLYRVQFLAGCGVCLLPS
jgi:hypothetical protein